MPHRERRQVCRLSEQGATYPTVEMIGSSSVSGLLPKPIIDRAVGLAADQPRAPIATKLEADGWIYRADAGLSEGMVSFLRVGRGIESLTCLSSDAAGTSGETICASVTCSAAALKPRCERSRRWRPRTTAP